MPAVHRFDIRTSRREELVDVTAQVRQALKTSGLTEGVVVVYTPHTTCGVTINENADPAVASDIILGLQKIAPIMREFRHMEGNSDAHIKSSLIGCSCQIPVSGGALLLGTWQGIYLAEFDGPRSRKLIVCA